MNDILAQVATNTEGAKNVPSGQLNRGVKLYAASLSFRSPVCVDDARVTHEYALGGETAPRMENQMNRRFIKFVCFLCFVSLTLWGCEDAPGEAGAGGTAGSGGPGGGAGAGGVGCGGVVGLA